MPNSNLEDEGIDELIECLRLEYAAGTLSKTKIDRLERIPGWSWVPDSSEQPINPAIRHG